MNCDNKQRDCNGDKAMENMLEESGQAHAVTMRMREVGSDILSDPDLAYSSEERAEAVYIAMERARLHLEIPYQPLAFSSRMLEEEQ